MYVSGLGSDTGWPADEAVRCGGALGLVSGLVVYRPSAKVSVHRTPGTRSPVRPSAVGWPRVGGDAVGVEPHTHSRVDKGSFHGSGPSGADGIGRVRENATYGGDPGVVSRETTVGDGDDPPVPQPRTGTGFVERARGQAAAPTAVRADGPPTVSQTVEFDLSAVANVTPAGTVYGRGAVPVDTTGSDETGATADAPASRRTSPSPRPHSATASVDTEVVMTDAYVSRETEDPPLAQEAKRAVEILNPSGQVTMPRPPSRRTMCVANQKGGVGKTTTAVNIAVALALHGNRVLVIDLDPQGNASTGLNVPHHAGVPDVYDCLIEGATLDSVTQPVEGIPNLWAIPATIDLAGAEIELVSVVARESRLRRAIEASEAEYDYIFIDCPPSLGLLTVNALVAAEEVLIPIQCEYYALEGVQALTSNIELVRSHLNPALAVSTVILTMYDRRTRLADLVEQDVRAHFGPKVLNAVIPRNVRVSEAPSYSQSVMTYDPGSRGAVSYFEAALEIATRGAEQGGAA
jgi:chromosome partitioning protein